MIGSDRSTTHGARPGAGRCGGTPSTMSSGWIRRAGLNTIRRLSATVRSQSRTKRVNPEPGTAESRKRPAASVTAPQGVPPAHTLRAAEPAPRDAVAHHAFKIGALLCYGLSSARAGGGDHGGEAENLGGCATTSARNGTSC